MTDTIGAPLKGKVAVVTGASRGIGESIALKFAKHGCTHIAITYGTKKADAEKVCASMREISPNIKTCAFAADVLDPEFGSNVVKQSLSGLGVDRIDIMVSNATYPNLTDIAPIEKLSKDSWDRWQNGTTWAPLTLARSVIDVMPKGGRIIFISSIASKMALGGPLIPYCCAKAGLDSLSRNLAAEWSVAKGVTVNSIGVGPTYTDSFYKSAEVMGIDAEVNGAFTMLKRIAQPEEIADIVAFTASPQASWIVGNQMPASGGTLSMLQG